MDLVALAKTPAHALPRECFLYVIGRYRQGHQTGIHPAPHDMRHFYLLGGEGSAHRCTLAEIAAYQADPYPDLGGMRYDGGMHMHKRHISTFQLPDEAGVAQFVQVGIFDDDYWAHGWIEERFWHYVPGELEIVHLSKDVEEWARAFLEAKSASRDTS